MEPQSKMLHIFLVLIIRRLEVPDIYTKTAIFQFFQVCGNPVGNPVVNTYYFTHVLDQKKFEN